MYYEYENLRDSITEFIGQVGTIKSEQVMAMYNDVNPAIIKWHLNALRINRMFTIENNIIHSVGAPVLQSYARDLYLDAVSVMTYFGRTKIRNFYACRYPQQLLFVTEDDNIYDVTVFSYSNVASNIPLLQHVMSNVVPEGVEDDVVHIAVIPNKEMSKQVLVLDFDSICVLDEKGNPTFYSANVEG